MPKEAVDFSNRFIFENNTEDPTLRMGYNADFEDAYREEDMKLLCEDEDELVNGQGVEGAAARNLDTLEFDDSSWMGRWSSEALQLLQKGDFYKALHYLGLCLDPAFRTQVIAESLAAGNTPVEGQFCLEMLSDPMLVLTPADELNLLEKRCLVLMKLRMFDRVWEDSRRILERNPNHALAFKCLLAALCKLNKLDQVAEVLKLWKKTSPSDLEMLESRTKLEGLIKAVTNGIEPKMAFSSIEETLGLSYDWLLGRKIADEGQWKYRPLPPGENSFVLCLQYRYGHCSLGEKCPDAHGEQELLEWKNRYSLSNMNVLLDKIKLDSGACYIKGIMDSLSGIEDERSILREDLPGTVHVSCIEPLSVPIQSCSGSFSWKFSVESKRPMHHVCLLYEIHRPYFHIASAFFQGSSNKVNLLTGKSSGASTSLQVLDISVSPTAMALTGTTTSSSAMYSYSVEISFVPEVFGTFRQTVVFDFGSTPKLVRHLSAEVIPSVENVSSGSRNSGTNAENIGRATSPRNELGSSIKSKGTWNYGNAEIVDSVTGERVQATQIGFALMNGNIASSVSTSNTPGVPNSTKDLTLTKENYKERMRFFLTQEEKARQEILSKYNVSAHLTMLNKYEITGGYNDGTTKYAVNGALFARMTLFRNLQEDTPVGRLILRSCNYVLLTKSAEVQQSQERGGKPRVYLCPITDKTKNAMYVDIGQTCVQELDLVDSAVASFDIQFQLDRTAFTEQKTVIDQISETHLNLLFPSFEREMYIPWTPQLQWNSSVETDKFRLNPKQKEALIAVTAEAAITPPILIIGPFGTGKTFTLAQCIRKILTQENSRIIICTQSNSAADLYIKEYLHPMVEEGNEVARPLRIYYELRSLKTVHSTVLQYSVTENGVFRNPTKEEVLRHHVIVVTLSTSYGLMGLDLPEDAFTHILLDEAAQAMESEAITPLMLAGPRTRLVLAGDHMQLSPELFSEHAKNFHPSLLERLHYSYPDNHPCKLMLCENYRSHSAIIQFASESFYQKKLECGISQPVHSKFFPLSFFVARGEDIQDADSTSYYNMAEVCEIAEKVAELISSWPETWGNWRHENAIGVLTPYPDQVVKIRARLRQKGLYNVSVERVLNVQGKQFRAVFLSTVRTHKPWVHILPKEVGNEVDLGFFSNPKLLNTALTRAQSLVAVVGDPVSLCSLGKCRRLWEDFIQICNDNKSLFGISLSQLKQNILGVELRLTWGLNPLANEFEPQPQPAFTPRPKSKFAQKVLSRLESEGAVPAPSGARAPMQSSRPHTTAYSTGPPFQKAGDDVTSTINPPQSQAQAQSLLGAPAVHLGGTSPSLLGSPFNHPAAQQPGPGIQYGVGPGGLIQPLRPPFMQQQTIYRKTPPGMTQLDRTYSNPSLGALGASPGFNPAFGALPIHQAYQMGLHPMNQRPVQGPPFIPTVPLLPPGTPPVFPPNVYASAAGLPLMHHHPGAYLVPLHAIQRQAAILHHQQQVQQHLQQQQTQHSIAHQGPGQNATQAAPSAFTPYLSPNQNSPRQQGPVKLIPRPLIHSPSAFPPLGASSVGTSQSHTEPSSQAVSISNANANRYSYRAAAKVSDYVSSPPASSSGLQEYASGVPLYRPQQQQQQQQTQSKPDIWGRPTQLQPQHQQQQMLQQQQQQLLHQQQHLQQQQQQHLLQRQQLLQLEQQQLALSQQQQQQQQKTTTTAASTENFPGGHVFSQDEIYYMKRVLEMYAASNASTSGTTTQPQQQQSVTNISNEPRSSASGSGTSGISSSYSTDSQNAESQSRLFQQQSASATQQQYSTMDPFDQSLRSTMYGNSDSTSALHGSLANKLESIWSESCSESASGSPRANSIQFNNSNVNPNPLQHSASAGAVIGGSSGGWNGTPSPVPTSGITTSASARFIREMSKNFGSHAHSHSHSSSGGAGRTYANAVKQQQQQQHQQEQQQQSQGMVALNKVVGSKNNIVGGRTANKKPQPLLLADIPPLFPDGVTFNKPSTSSSLGLGSGIAVMSKKAKKKNSTTKKE